MNHQQHPSREELEGAFPSNKFPRMWVSQRQSLDHIAIHGSSLIESPTGTGKTAVEYAILNAVRAKGRGPLFLIVPNKALVGQIEQEFPSLTVALGRNEHPCLYYEGEELKADEIPCSLLVNCPHRVDQATGQTYEPGATPCPYLQQKFEAKRGAIVLCTMSFYLFTQLFSHEWETPACLVIDEVHRLPDIIRGALSYEITDYHLARAIELIKSFAPAEARGLREFRAAMRRITKRRPPEQGSLLADAEVEKLLGVLEKIDGPALKKAIAQAIRSGAIDVRKEREMLKKVEVIIRDLRRYITSFRLSLSGDNRQPLNYTYAYYRRELSGRERVQHKLVVKCFYVVPLIRKVLSPFTVAFSATIGNPEVFGYESGINAPFLRLASNFPVGNTRLFMPTDTSNLALKNQSRGDVTKALRKIAQTARDFARKGLRSLVVVVSNLERDKFLFVAGEEGLQTVSYGNGVTAKEAAIRFRDGEGEALVGTTSNYGEGVDLPKQTAPIIFFFRPGYANPSDPGTQFEERRFGDMRWARWNWKVITEALQVRGRNIRNHADMGVTFFVSQQFRRFLFGSLPGWLQPAYRGNNTWDECVKEAEKLLLLA